MALTPDGRCAVTAGEDFCARVWDTATGRCAAVLSGHSGWVVDVALTPDARRAITASHDGTARRAYVTGPTQGLAGHEAMQP